MTTTRRGSLLKQQVPVRTFTGWDDVVPGFFEADLVAHCGTWAEGSFLNTELLAYCEREQITFTRDRVAKKNDQCYVEQKNGAIVRQLVGYDRFEGEHAYRQLAELYRAVRLYVNFFQPSMKLRIKEREGGHLRRRYDPAKTPFQRLLSAGV